ncbi:MAG: hypothetical protein M0Z67_04225 [Nitrospiraceae bacterium]|nr:hypothetical protein [Nitrospiraceae bacterium]
MKKISISRTAGAFIGGTVIILFVLVAVSFAQGFTGKRILSGPCVVSGTAAAAETAVMGRTVPVHAATIVYSPSVRGGHLWAGNKIDIDAPPKGIHERFSFQASGSILRTAASVRRGPQWNYADTLNVIQAVGTYAGALVRVEIDQAADAGLEFEKTMIYHGGRSA